MATLARRMLGEEQEVQWKRMLGHHKNSTSDLYALFEPSNLGKALAVTNEIIESIENAVPGAFSSPFVGVSSGSKFDETP